VLEWARRADAAGFSALGTLDRPIYSNWEPLVALGAGAAATERIGLMTAVLLLPYRQNAAVVAKQAATQHVLSGGRLTLGVGTGSREEDYTAFGLSATSTRSRASTPPAWWPEPPSVRTPFRKRLDLFRDAGADEVVMFAASADPEQVDLLARAAL